MMSQEKDRGDVMGKGLERCKGEVMERGLK